MHDEFFRPIPSRPFNQGMGPIRESLQGAGNLNDYYYNQLELMDIIDRKKTYTKLTSSYIQEEEVKSPTKRVRKKIKEQKQYGKPRVANYSAEGEEAAKDPDQGIYVRVPEGRLQGLAVAAQDE